MGSMCRHLAYTYLLTNPSSNQFHKKSKWRCMLAWLYPTIDPLDRMVKEYKSRNRLDRDWNCFDNNNSRWSANNSLLPRYRMTELCRCNRQ